MILQDTGRYLAIPYSGIDAFFAENYRLIIVTGQERLQISQMGRDLDSLYLKLWEFYNARTLRALFVSGQPMFEAEGEYAYSDDGGKGQGIAKISLFDNCLCLLPPCSEARRIPLCFMNEPSFENFTISMSLDTGETYRVMRLGNRTQRLNELIRENMRIIHENAIDAVKRLDGTLGKRSFTNRMADAGRLGRADIRAIRYRSLLCRCLPGQERREPSCGYVFIFSADLRAGRALRGHQDRTCLERAGGYLGRRDKSGQCWDSGS